MTKHDSANLGARKAIDETLATMANPFVPCGFRFHGAVSSDIGLGLSQRFAGIFVNPTGLFAHACFRFKPTTFIRLLTCLA